MPPPSTELVLYEHGPSCDKIVEPSVYDIPRSPNPPRGGHLVKGDILGALLTSWGPNLISTSLLGHLRTRPQNISGFTIAINVIKAQFTLFKRRIDALEAQNDDLRHDNMMCHSNVGALESELTYLRADYYSELFERRQETRRATEDKEEIKSLRAEIIMQRTEIMILNEKTAQADIFMQAILDLNLHDPVLQAAWRSVKDGGDAEEALVNAVLKASSRKDSAWSRIIPAVVGPRSPEHYLSALDLALKARRDLQERKKISGFWKLKAMTDPSNAGTLTPSTSQISDICEELMQQQELSTHPVPPIIQGIEMSDAVPEIFVADDELPSEETVTQMQHIAAEPQEIKSNVSFPRSIDSVDTQMTVTEALDTAHESSSSPVVQDTDDAYLLSEPESMTSTVTVKPMNIVKSEPVTDDTRVVEGSEPAHVDATFNAFQDSQLVNKEITASRPSTPTPLHDDVSFSVDPSTPIKSPKSSKVSSYLPVTPLRSIPRTRPTVSPQSSSTAKLSNKSRPIKENANAQAKSVPPSAKVLGTTSPIRSRLSTPKNYVSKRPVLQGLDLNVTAAPSDSKESCDTSDDDDIKSPVHNIRRSSTKNLRKRRGVILVERMNAGESAKVKSDLADRLESPQVSMASPDSVTDRKTLAQHVAEDDFGGHLARDSSDLEESPVIGTVANDALSERQHLRSHSSNVVEVQRPAVPSPTSAIISRFIENFSDSDLGSLEMTEDEDEESDCENTRGVQSNVTPVRPKRTIRYSDEGEDDTNGAGNLSTSISNTAVVSALTSSESTSPSVASTSRSRPATPFSKSLSWLSKTKKDGPSLSASSSGSSYTMSTASGSDGQINKKKTKLPLFGLARRLGRKSTTPPPPNEIDTSSSDLPAHTHASPPVLPIKEHESSPPPANPSKPNFWNKKNPSNDADKDNNPVTPKKIISPSKIPKSDSTQKRSPVAGLRPSVGQSFIRRLSNVPSPKSKPAPQATSQSIPRPVDSESTYLAPPSPQYTKPRSHTINTVSPLPPSLSTPSPQSLMAGSTKPRSHTVNTYSPTTRSPLSRLAGDSSTNVHSTPTKATRVPPASGSSLPRSLVPKPTTSSPKNVKNTTTTVPPRIHKSSTKNQSTSHEVEPKPPTAAFMRPAANPASSSTRRMTNSIAPLIPNWTPSASNGLTPKQCRSMFRNSLSMVVR